MRPSVPTDMLYIISHNSLSNFPTTRAATHVFKANSTKPYTNNNYKLNIANKSCLLAALFCTEIVVENCSHVTPVRKTIDQLVTQLEETGSVRVPACVRACACASACACMCACACVTNEHRNANVQ